jgi:hypothetical protein
LKPSTALVSSLSGPQPAKTNPVYFPRALFADPHHLAQPPSITRKIIFEASVGFYINKDIATIIIYGSIQEQQYHTTFLSIFARPSS